MIEDEELEYQYAIRPNKSEIKRENAALEELGEELTRLPDERLHPLALPPKLLEAIKLAQTITQHHSAYKRQRKFIAKLLRDVDSAAIRQQLERHSQQSARQTYFLHVIERWRDRLLDGEDQELNTLMAENPAADRQKLRQLIRDARKERQEIAPPRSSRLLFKYLKELLAEDEADEAAVEDFGEE